MKKKLLLFSILILSTTKIFSQSPAIQWQKSYGGDFDEVANSVQQTSDGGYIVAGHSASNTGDVSGHHGLTSNQNYDFWVLKTDGSGIIQWQKSLGGTGMEIATCVKQTTDGGYIVAGYTNSNDGDVSGYHGGNGTDLWVVKLDAAGAITWQNTIGGTESDGANSIQQTSDGGYIAVGYSFSNDGDVSGHHGQSSHSDMWVVKLSGTGSVQWQYSLGGTYGDAGMSVYQTTDGGYIIGGFSHSNDGDVSGHHGTNNYDDFWVVKLDGSGAIQWQNSFGGTNTDEAFFIQQTTDGGYIVAGETNSNDGDVTGYHVGNGVYDYWVIKLNGAGILQWQKALGGSMQDIAYAVWQTSDGGYVVAGESDSNDGDVSGSHGMRDSWIVKLDGSGTMLWQKSMGGSDADFSGAVQQTADGGFIVAGYSRSSDGDAGGNHGMQDFWVVKLDAEAPVAAECLQWDLLNSTSVSYVGNSLIVQTEVIGQGTNAPFMSVFGYNGNGQQLWVGNSGWQMGPVDLNRFIEFSVSPIAGQLFNISNVSFDYYDFQSGTDFNIIAFDAYYSTDGWNSSSLLGSATYLGTSVQSFSSNVTVSVNSSQTFSVKIYPYALQNGIAMTPTFATHKSFKICGQLTADPQAAECINWDLMSSEVVTTTNSNIIAQSEMLGAGTSAPFMSVFGYNSTGQQLWVGNTGWVMGTTDMQRYIEFNASPVAGKIFNVSNISFNYADFQSGTNFNIIAFDTYYSTDGWNTYTLLGARSYMGTSVQTFSSSITASVNSTQSFSVRIFPYALQNGSAMTPTFAIHNNFKMCGYMTTDPIMSITPDESNKNMTVEIYPVPANNFVIVSILGYTHTNAEIIINDMAGRHIRTISEMGNLTAINVSTLSDGIYNLSVISGGIRNNKRFVVQK